MDKLTGKKIFADYISRNNSFLLSVLGTLLLPKTIVTSFLANNRGKNTPWKEKKSCLTLSFDCDYPQDVEAIPFVLKLLAKYSLKTTFACVGLWIEKYPKEHKMILEYGHEIMNHTYSHPDNELLNPGRKFRTIPRHEKKEEVENGLFFFFTFQGS